MLYNMMTAHTSHTRTEGESKFMVCTKCEKFNVKKMSFEFLNIRPEEGDEMSVPQTWSDRVLLPRRRTERNTERHGCFEQFMGKFACWRIYQSPIHINL